MKVEQETELLPKIKGPWEEMKLELKPCWKTPSSSKFSLCLQLMNREFDLAFKLSGILILKYEFYFIFVFQIVLTEAGAESNGYITLSLKSGPEFHMPQVYNLC